MVEQKMISKYTEEAVALLLQMIRIPSVSRDEAAVADLIQETLQEMGLNPRRHGNNVWCIDPNYNPQRPTLLLDAHIDTVKPVSAWKTSPFEPVLDGDMLLGLGSNDDGGSVVSLLQAYRYLIQKNQAYNLIYSASCEEEVSGKNGLESILPLLPPVTAALVGEPTDMQPAIAEKGLMVLDVTAHGKSGHAARNEGINAIYRALDDICWVRDFRFEKESPLLGPVKMTATVVQAGTQHNVIPDQCSFVVDVRSNELYSNQELFDIISEKMRSDVKARSFRLNSSRMEMEHPLVQRALALGLEPFGSPTLSNQALMPFPSMKMGPGSSSRSHTAGEYILVSEIDHAIGLYIQLLDGLLL